MSRFQFECRVSVAPETGKAEVVYFQFRGGEIAQSRELVPGRLLLDLDRRGSPMGLEVLAPVPLDVLRAAARRWPAPLTDFVFALLPPAFVEARAAGVDPERKKLANGPGRGGTAKSPPAILSGGQPPAGQPRKEAAKENGDRPGPRKPARQAKR
jgi:hypothetical protein